MCGRYEFTVEQCAEIRQIVDVIQRKFGLCSGSLERYCHRPGRLFWYRWITHRPLFYAEKPLFRKSLITKRCVIPSTAFYEWGAAGASAHGC